MYLLNSDGRSYCRMVARLGMVGGNAIETSYSLNTIRYYGDRTFGYGFGDENPGFRTGWFPTAQCLGIPANEADKPYPVPFEVHKPNHIAYVGRDDYNLYYEPGSSFFAGLADRETWNRENQVYHISYRGDIRDSDGSASRLHKDGTGLTDIIVSPGGIPVMGYHATEDPAYPIPNWGRAAKHVGTNAKGQGIFELRNVSPYVFSYATFDLVSQIKALTSWFTLEDEITYGIFGPYTARIVNWVDNGSHQSADILHVDCEYEYQFIWNNTYDVRYHIHKLIDVRVVPFFGSNYPTAENIPGTGAFQLSDSSVVSMISTSVPGGGPDVGNTPRMYVVSSTIDGDLMQYEADNVPNFVSYRFADRRFLNRRSDLHGGVFDALMKDIRPSAFMSAADALNKHLLALSTNHIQTLQKLSSVIDLLPELTRLPSLVSRLSHGDIGALKDLIDYLSGEILRFRFSQAPAARALDELIGSDINGYLKSLTKKDDYIIYGDFTYQIPDSMNPYEDGRLLIVTRSKISISQDLSTLMEAILMVNSIGLLPSLSRLWEILPFSFVIDWFTGMNKRLKLVDTQLAYMCFRTNWCLNSFRLAYYPSSDALSTFGLEEVSDDRPFYISAYRREKSVYMPRLRDSRFDFLAAGGPNPMTAGALAWQLFT